MCVLVSGAGQQAQAVSAQQSTRPESSARSCAGVPGLHLPVEDLAVQLNSFLLSGSQACWLDRPAVLQALLQMVGSLCSTQLPTRAFQTCQKLPLHLLEPSLSFLFYNILIMGYI